MRILVAEDDPVSRRVLETSLQKWGYDVVSVGDGAAAWAVLTSEAAPRLAILDWMMPEVDGVELCRRLRQTRSHPLYIILLTARGSKEDIVTGLQAGADDYVAKPFDREELRARIQVGVRMVRLQAELAERVEQVQQALARVKQLQGLLPICSYCKKIRDDQNYWIQVEQYIAEHSEAQFSHGICPECYARYVRAELDALRRGSES